MKDKNLNVNLNVNEVRLLSLPVIPLRGMTIMPGTVIHFDLNRDKSIQALEFRLSWLFGLNVCAIVLCVNRLASNQFGSLVIAKIG